MNKVVNTLDTKEKDNLDYRHGKENIEREEVGNIKTNL